MLRYTPDESSRRTQWYPHYLSQITTMINDLAPSVGRCYYSTTLVTAVTLVTVILVLKLYTIIPPRAEPPHLLLPPSQPPSMYLFQRTKRTQRTSEVGLLPMVALCIAGQARTFNLTKDAISGALILPIVNDTDVFIAVDPTRSGINGTVYSNQQLYTISGSLPNLRSLHILPPRSSKFDEHSWYGEYSTKACLSDIWSHEMQRNVRYTWVIRARPDVVYSHRLPTFAAWPTWWPPTKIPHILFSAHHHFSTSNWLLYGTCIKEDFSIMTRPVADILFRAWPRHKPQKVLFQINCFKAHLKFETPSDAPCLD